MMYEQQPSEQMMKMTMDVNTNNMIKKKEKRKVSSSSKSNNIEGDGGVVEVVEERLEDVNLSGMNLDTLPSPSLNLAMIFKLDLSNNNIEVIPESLTARLLNLVILDIHSNQLKSLPNSMGCLSKLKTLNISGNMIESLPKSIENCRSLEDINANFNKLTKLPDTIGFELVNLKKLSVNSNKIALLPYSLSSMTTLRILDARLNCLRSLPEGLENLISLEILNVSQNFQYLQTLPYSIGLLISLTELDISYNKITTLPDSIGCLKRLQKLSVEGNPLVYPRVEIMEQKLDTIKEYLSERMNRSPKTPTKNKIWLTKFTKWASFNGRGSSNVPRDEMRESFIMAPEYRSTDGFSTPKNTSTGLFSPRRIFSPRHYFSK
ncbi:hypothetical protein MKW98_007820 [Papaver atlanticum]|uniref:Uncharacterized protein n=1 Tax=Papaver atlanticum TaxID=357466 RepID=A0AAD4X4G5_9MAGN|nr:hypothetical protein MKW98_007820 [Papaver atlanticum]